MSIQQGQTEITIVRETNLGQHVLFLMSDDSIDLMRLPDEPQSYLADNVLRLSSEEAYLLFISLQEMYK